MSQLKAGRGMSPPPNRQAGSPHGSDLLAHSTHSGLSSVAHPPTHEGLPGWSAACPGQRVWPAVPVSKASHGEQPVPLDTVLLQHSPASHRTSPYNPGLGPAGLLSSWILFLGCCFSVFLSIKETRPILLQTATTSLFICPG